MFYYMAFKKECGNQIVTIIQYNTTKEARKLSPREWVIVPSSATWWQNVTGTESSESYTSALFIISHNRWKESADLPNIKVNKLEFIGGFQEQVKRSGIYNFNSGNMTRDMYIKTFKIEM